MATLPKEQTAVVSYQREEDAQKAFECKTVLFNNMQIELHLAGKVHSYVEDARLKEEQRKVAEVQRNAKKRLLEVKTSIQKNLTVRLTMLLAAKGLVTEGEAKKTVQTELETLKQEMESVKKNEDYDDLLEKTETEFNLSLRISMANGERPELKALNEALRVGSDESRNMVESTL